MGLRTMPTYRVTLTHCPPLPLMRPCIIASHYGRVHGVCVCVTGSIEALVVNCLAGDELRAVRAVHEAFLHEYSLTAAQVPLLWYRPERDARGDVFSLARPGDAPCPSRPPPPAAPPPPDK